MNFYYSRLQINELEEIIKPYKSDVAKHIFFEQEPFKFLDLYIQDCLNKATSRLDDSIKIFNRANIFIKKKESTKGDPQLIICNDFHECNRNIRINSKNITEYENILPPSYFEFITQIISIMSGFGQIYTIEEKKELTTPDNIIYEIKTYAYIDDMEKIDKWINEPYKQKDFFNETPEINILSIKKMPYMEVLKLKEVFVDFLTGKIDLIQNEVINKFSNYVKLNGEPFSLINAFITRGAMSLIYKILYLTIHFSYFQSKKKNQYLTELEAIYNQKTEQK